MFVQKSREHQSSPRSQLHFPSFVSLDLDDGFPNFHHDTRPTGQSAWG